MQAPTPAARLQRDLPVLNDFPCVDIPPHADDSRYPMLQWQQRAARRALHRVAQVGSVLAFIDLLPLQLPALTLNRVIT